MNVIHSASRQIDLNRSLTEDELFISCNDDDNVSVPGDESALSSSYHKPQYTSPKDLKQQVIALSSKAIGDDLDDATAVTMASSINFSVFTHDESGSEVSESQEREVLPSFKAPQHKTIPSTEKRVSFGDLTISSHFVELGGSGVPGSGPSISLGWEQASNVTFPSLLEYDDAKSYDSRKGIEMLHPKKQRVDLLLESGYTLNQIHLVTKENETIRKQRSKTVQQLTFSDRTKSKLKKLAVWKKVSSSKTD